MQGMRVNVKSMLDLADKEAEVKEGQSVPNDGWVKTGNRIEYKLSKLSVNSVISTSAADGKALFT